MEATMADKHLREFYGRLSRIERTHMAGGGFEADGTLGMFFHNAHRRRRSRRPRILASLIVGAAILFTLKASLHVAIGGAVYDEKIALMLAGTDIDRAGAWVMQADPLTLAIAGQIRRLLG